MECLECKLWCEISVPNMVFGRWVLVVADNVVKLKSSLRKLYGRHHDLVDRYGISMSEMTTDMFHWS